MLPSWLMPKSIAPMRSTSMVGLGVVSAMELTELACRRGGAVLGRCRVEMMPCRAAMSTWLIGATSPAPATLVTSGGFDAPSSSSSSFSFSPLSLGLGEQWMATRWRRGLGTR